MVLFKLCICICWSIARIMLLVCVHNYNVLTVNLAFEVNTVTKFKIILRHHGKEKNGKENMQKSR